MPERCAQVCFFASSKKANRASEIGQKVGLAPANNGVQQFSASPQQFGREPGARSSLAPVTCENRRAKFSEATLVAIGYLFHFTPRPASINARRGCTGEGLHPRLFHSPTPRLLGHFRESETCRIGLPCQRVHKRAEVFAGLRVAHEILAKPFSKFRPLPTRFRERMEKREAASFHRLRDDARPLGECSGSDHGVIHYRHASRAGRSRRSSGGSPVNHGRSASKSKRMSRRKFSPWASPVTPARSRFNARTSLFANTTRAGNRWPSGHRPDVFGSVAIPSRA